MFLKSVSQCSARLPNVLFCAIDVCALTVIYNPTFLYFVVFVFGCHEKCPNSVGTFKMHLDTSVFADLFNLFPLTLDVGDHH